MSLELTGVHGLLKRHKLFTHKLYYYFQQILLKKCLRHLNPLTPIHGGIRGSFFYRFPA